MNRERLQPILIILGLSVMLTFLFVQSRTANLHRHNKIASTITQLLHQDTLLIIGILDTRSGHLRHYDPLSDEKHNVFKLINELRRARADSYRESDPATDKATDDAEKLLQQKIRMIEYFKSHNAILRNSLLYLPLAVKQHWQEAPGNRLNNDLDNLLHEVLLYNTNPTAQAKARAQEQIRKMRATHKYDADLLRHAELIVNNRESLMTIIDELLGLPTKQSIENINTAYSHHYDKQLERANIYRGVLYVIAIALLAYVLQIFLVLRASVRKLNHSIRDLDFQKYAIDQHAIVAITDAKGIITYVNDKFCEISQYTSAEIIGQTHKLVNSGLHPGAFSQQLWVTISKGKVWHGEIQNRRKDGSLYWVDTTIVPFPDASGKPQYYVAIQADITERKHNEDELARYQEHLEEIVRQRTQELTVAKEQAESANRAKSAFLANMSHELRTPLNAIIGFSEMMHEGLTGTLSNEQQQHTKDIFDAGQHLLALINDILDLSKIESDAMQLDIHEVDPSRVVEVVLTMHRERAGKHRIELSAQLGSDIGMIQTDERKLKQVLLNLVSNAVKFTPDGGKVDVKVSCEHDQVTFSVTDTGIGIKAEDFPRLFQPFQQLAETLTKTYGGTGLGLALSKKLVEMHGGQFAVTSEYGKGSTFSFSMPRVAAPKCIVDAATGMLTWERVVEHIDLIRAYHDRKNLKFGLMHIKPLSNVKAHDDMEFAAALKKIVRTHEVFGHGRTSGDYYAILMDTNHDEMAAARSRFQSALLQLGMEIEVTEVIYPDDGNDLQTLLVILG